MLKYNAAAFQGATVSDLENSIATQGQGTARIQGLLQVQLLQCLDLIHLYNTYTLKI